MFTGRPETDYVALKRSTRLSNLDSSNWRNITGTATFYMEYALIHRYEEMLWLCGTHCKSRRF